MRAEALALFGIFFGVPALVVGVLVLLDPVTRKRHLWSEWRVGTTYLWERRKCARCGLIQARYLPLDALTGPEKIGPCRGRVA